MSYNNKIYVYRNLRKDCYSIKILGKVRHRVNWIVIDGSLPEAPLGFQVSVKGRMRVLNEGRKNVHAYVWAYDVCLNEKITKDLFLGNEKNCVKIRYDPYYYGYFYEMKNHLEVVGAEMVYLTPKGIFAENPVYK